MAVISINTLFDAKLNEIFGILMSANSLLLDKSLMTITVLENLSLFFYKSMSSSSETCFLIPFKNCKNMESHFRFPLSKIKGLD